MKPIVTVITPTTGAPYLKQAIESVCAQTYANIQHLVVVDGIYQEANKIIDECKMGVNGGDIDVVNLPYATGIDRYNGHRIYGAAIYLAKGDYVCFLDEDNWFEPDHIESLMDVIEAGNQWAFSLRKITDKDGNYMCNDDCESLGKWPSCLDERDYFVDVGCYFLPKNIALQTTPLWYRKAREPNVPEVDRILCHVLRENKLTYDSNYKYTLNYRTGNTERSVQKEFFLHNNEKMKQKYNGTLPWQKI
jgi:glycosyltransferase involved in cell wall biosynthesis